MKIKKWYYHQVAQCFYLIISQLLHLHIFGEMHYSKIRPDVLIYWCSNFFSEVQLIQRMNKRYFILMSKYVPLLNPKTTLIHMLKLLENLHVSNIGLQSTFWVVKHYTKQFISLFENKYWCLYLLMFYLYPKVWKKMCLIMCE